MKAILLGILFAILLIFMLTIVGFIFGTKELRKHGDDMTDYDFWNDSDNWGV